MPTPLDPDIAIVGGGINGCGIARDLAGRGWRVLLCEQDDLACGTSSASTKLIHGGLRYLEHREFGLVRKALQEREVLLQALPHIARPLRFVLPHDRSMRPAWLIRLGLFLYDQLAHRAWLEGSCRLDLRSHPAGAPLQPQFEQGFAYSDGWVDDARLVILNAVDAAARGALILPRTRCTQATRGAQHWTLQLQSDSGVSEVCARLLVNAAGPQAEQFLALRAHAEDGAPVPRRRLRLVKGSHIVVPKLFEHDDAYLLQSPDRRIVFALPYEDRFTLIGTTDVDVDPADAVSPQISADEVAYLCAQVNRCFSRQVQPSDVVWHFAGVRPLLEDAAGNASEVTRDYLLDLDAAGAPLLSVWGGKITTFRRLAEDAADRIGRQLGAERPGWTAGAPLPGGDLAAWTGPAPGAAPPSLAHFAATVQHRWPWLPEDLTRRWCRSYGTRIALLLGDADAPEALGAWVAPGLCERELQYLVQHEWARSADDVLWRRTKLGLHLAPADREAVAAWLQRTPLC